LRGVRALVTGAAGFVGRRLLPRLARAGWEVTGTDREVDVADPEAVGAALSRARPDLVVHLAAVSSVAASRRDPQETYRVNFLGTRALLAGAARAAPAARVILASTGDVYGSAQPGAPPFREDCPLRPRSPYARTKAAADLLGAEYAARGLDVVRARLFNHTGPGQSDAFVLASFARQAAEIAAGRREPRLRVGNLDSVRDFLDVDDVLEAYVALADRALAAGVYNVASGVPVRIGDALEAILRAAGIEATVEVDPERVRPADRSVGDASRLRLASGWAPRTPFARTLERVVADWRERISAP
jgi:GDP-4-dehydro-6-deoxy-D-mannose reductase